MIMNFKLALTTKPHWPILFLMCGYISIALYLGVFLNYDFFRSDVLSYWEDSLAWQTPFHVFHVPGYPLIIALVRGITFGVPSAVGLMMSINLGTFLASAFLIYRILQSSGTRDELAAIGALLFGLWPFVGLTYTVDPLADMPAMFLLLMGLYFLLISRRRSAALFFGLSMITHKAMWLFAAALVIVDLFYRRNYPLKRHISFVAMMFLPLGTLWILGSFYHNSITWLFSSNLDVEFAAQSNLPILDGLLGTMMQGGLKGLSKGILLTGFACISAFTIYATLRLKYANFQYALAISLASLVLFLVLNQHEIWAAMRFGRLLVIPLMLVANTRSPLRNIAWWNSPVTLSILSILFLSQFGYAWYIAVVYFG